MNLLNVMKLKDGQSYCSILAFSSYKLNLSQLAGRAEIGHAEIYILRCLSVFIYASI